MDDDHYKEWKGFKNSWGAGESAGKASEPAGRASDLAGWAPEPTERALEPAGKPGHSAICGVHKTYLHEKLIARPQ